MTTAEGDRITITADLETDFRSLSYESHAEADRTVGNVGAKYTHSTIQRNFGVTVNGDLNEKELSDLTFLVMSINAWNRVNVGFRVASGTYDKAFGIDKSGLS